MTTNRNQDAPQGSKPHADVFTHGVADPQLGERLRATLAELSAMATKQPRSQS